MCTIGCAGLHPTVAAIKAGKDICLANKETLIAGGPYVLPLAREHGVNILPADSEHSVSVRVHPALFVMLPAPKTEAHHLGHRQGSMSRHQDLGDTGAYAMRSLQPIIVHARFWDGMIRQLMLPCLQVYPVHYLRTLLWVEVGVSIYVQVNMAP